ALHPASPSFPYTTLFRSLIETTGVADPSPVIQSFFVDEDLKTRVRLDAVITLVDARHIWLHLDENREAREQIAYGDVVLLNKTEIGRARLNSSHEWISYA